MAQRIKRPTLNQKIGGSNPSVVDILFYTKEISQKVCQYKGRIRRVTSNQKIGGSNPSVVDILFYTKESSYKGCQYKGQHLATEQATDTIDRTHGPTDKASDFESEDWGFESLGRLFLAKETS